MLVLLSNGGELRSNNKGYLKGVGWVWYHLEAITNILSLGLIEEQYHCDV